MLTEGKRDEKTSEIRKTKLFVFSEDFVAFFRMLHETAQFIRDNPVPDEFAKNENRIGSAVPVKPRMRLHPTRQTAAPSAPAQDRPPQLARGNANGELIHLGFTTESDKEESCA